MCLLTLAGRHTLELCESGCGRPELQESRVGHTTQEIVWKSN